MYLQYSLVLVELFPTFSWVYNTSLCLCLWWRCRVLWRLLMSYKRRGERPEPQGRLQVWRSLYIYLTSFYHPIGTVCNSSKISCHFILNFCDEKYLWFDPFCFMWIILYYIINSTDMITYHPVITIFVKSGLHYGVMRQEGNNQLIILL